MTNIRFLNGLNTIGASIAEFSTSSTRIITDFGMTVNFQIGTAQSLIEKHVLPNFPELFGEERKTNVRYKHEAIFITHLHLDHTAALAYLKSDIPVYLSRSSYKLYCSLVKQGLDLALNVNFQIFDYEVPVNIGDLTVTAYQSDHDVLGVAAFLIEDGKHSFGQSGDVRLNGPHKEDVNKWITIFKKKQLDLLILEATSFSFPEKSGLKENKKINVELKCLRDFEDILNKNNDLIVINPYPRNIERVLELNRLANELNKPIVWEKQYAKVLREFTESDPIFVLDDGNLGLNNTIGLIPVTILTIMNNISHFCLQNSFENLENLSIFYKFIYVHCNGDPIGEYDLHYQRLKSFLRNRNSEFIDIGVSGHATREEICEIAMNVAAKKTVIWHSSKPNEAIKELEGSGLHFLNPIREKKYHFE